MNREKEGFLSENQFSSILISFVLGPEFIRFTNVVVDIAHEDSWLAAMFALVYPLYIILTGLYIIKKHPKDNLITLNRIYFGEIIGNGINIIFMTEFIMYLGSIISDFVAMSRIFIVAFLTPLKIIMVCIVIAVYGASKGLINLGKISEAVKYIIIPTILLSLYIFKEGSVLNLQPAFRTPFYDIVKASSKLVYHYAGFEGMLLYHPYVKKEGNITKSSISAFATVGIIWVWTVFATIFYLGADIAPKSLWSFSLVYDSFTLPVINNIRYVFIFAWTLVCFRIICTYMFTSMYIANAITKISMQKLRVYLSLLIFYLSTVFLNDLLKEKIFNVLSPLYAIFNVLIFLSLALIISIKLKQPKTSEHIG
ncbi:GerAB/ArcD/ProY family transporter [Clostridium thermarum]|uniref:GerAB/ArcD/ProY family transporter n=1 Tax=Clostridium thermarum TaxID=1716543 RepID=UPI0013D3A46B|nr:GerAB/ArcD/ProY family transporter [Clostridium thermarum]